MTPKAVTPVHQAPGAARQSSGRRLVPVERVQTLDPRIQCPTFPRNRPFGVERIEVGAVPAEGERQAERPLGQKEEATERSSWRSMPQSNGGPYGSEVRGYFGVSRPTPHPTRTPMEDRSLPLTALTSIAREAETGTPPWFWQPHPDHPPIPHPIAPQRAPGPVPGRSGRSPAGDVPARPAGRVRPMIDGCYRRRHAWPRALPRDLPRAVARGVRGQTGAAAAADPRPARGHRVERSLRSLAERPAGSSRLANGLHAPISAGGLDAGRSNVRALPRVRARLAGTSTVIREWPILASCPVLKSAIPDHGCDQLTGRQPTRTTIIHERRPVRPRPDCVTLRYP